MEDTHYIPNVEYFMENFHRLDDEIWGESDIAEGPILPPTIKIGPHGNIIMGYNQGSPPNGANATEAQPEQLTPAT